MHRSFPGSASASFALLLLLQGCGLPPAPDLVLPTDSIPAGYPVADELGAVDTPRDTSTAWSSNWWADFGDARLDSLVVLADLENLDLAEALARVQEAEARVGIATAGLLPQLNAGADASRSESPNNTGFGRQIGELLGGLEGDSTGGAPDGDSAQAAPDRFANTNYSTSLALSWELDLWGRIRNDRRAAVADLLGSREDLAALHISVVAQTISTWFELSDLTDRIALTEEIVEVLQERAELAENRYNQGLATSFELYQLRGDLRATQTSLPQLRGQLADAERRLALLTASFPGELNDLIQGAGEGLSAVEPTPVPPGIPADVLAQRPDVRAAARRLEAARFRVGARRAELLPRLTLTGSLGLQSSEASELFDLDQWFSNLAAGLTAPLFQGGRLRANLAASEAAYAQRVAAYTRVVLTAVGEVEATLRQYQEQRARAELVSDQRAEAEASLNLQVERYSAGVGGYADYLDALRNALSVRSSAATARRDLALARLAVHRALGGSWVTPDSSNTSDR